MGHGVQQPVFARQQGNGVPVRFLNAEHAGHGGAADASDFGAGQYHGADLLGGAALHIGGDAVVGFGAQVGFQGFGESLSQPQMGCAGGQGAGVGNQAGLRGQDDAAVQGLEAVFPQSGSGGGQVGDEVGVTGGGGGFQGAAHGNDGKVVDAPLKEVAAQQPLVFGGNPQLAAPFVKLQGQVGQVVNGGHIQPAVGDGQDEFAASVLQVVNDGDDGTVVVAIFQQAVQAGNAHFGAAFLNLAGNIGGALEQRLHAGQGGNAAGVAARVGPADLDAARRHKAQRGVAQFAVAWNYQSHRVIPSPYSYPAHRLWAHRPAAQHLAA